MKRKSSWCPFETYYMYDYQFWIFINTHYHTTFVLVVKSTEIHKTVPLYSDSCYTKKKKKWNELQNNKTNKIICTPSENSDQRGHRPSLIRVFAVHLKKSWVLRALPAECIQRRLCRCAGWSEFLLGAHTLVVLQLKCTCHLNCCCKLLIWATSWENLSLEFSTR